MKLYIEAVLSALSEQWQIHQDKVKKIGLYAVSVLGIVAGLIEVYNFVWSRQNAQEYQPLYYQVIASGVETPTPVKVIDLSGRWFLETIVEKSSFKPFETGQLTVVYELFLSQLGQKVMGMGEKQWEVYNAKRMEYSRKDKTPIRIEGKVEPNRLVLTIMERGKHRDSSGLLDGEIENLSIVEIVGNWSTTAADCDGKFRLYKE